MKRRELLKLGSAGLASLATGTLPINSNLNIRAKINRKAAGEYLKKGFMLELFPSGDEVSLMDQFRMLHKAGFHGVEPSSGLNRAEVLRAKNETGLEIPSVVVSTHWSQPLSSPDPTVREAGLDGLKVAIQDAHEYGAGCVLLVPGVVTEETSYDEVYQRSQDEIRKALPLAEELGVVIAIENVWNHFLLSPLEAARYVDEFNSSYVGWYLDLGNIVTYSWPEHWVRILGDRIAMIHLKEFSREKQNQEGLGKGFQVNFLEGDNNWPEIMKALREVDYKGYGIAEPPHRDENLSGEEWLTDCVSGRMDEIFKM
ncbi:MAG: sugar phosphate isomerase/epimerase family protein [Balneolales bacterium]